MSWGGAADGSVDRIRRGAGGRVVACMAPAGCGGDAMTGARGQYRVRIILINGERFLFPDDGTPLPEGATLDSLPKLWGSYPKDVPPVVASLR